MEIDRYQKEYIQHITIIASKCIFLISLSAFLVNGAWFFFDDFKKTLFQESVILSATMFSFISIHLSKRGYILQVFRCYLVYGLFFGVMIMWSAGDFFIFTGISIISICSLMAIFAMQRKESVFWCIMYFSDGIAGLFLRYFINIWESGFSLIQTVQISIFMFIAIGAFIFLGVNISSMLKTAMNNINVQKQEIEEYASKLYKLSITDKLTGLNNRLHLDEVLNSELERSKRYNASFAVIMMDIDYFKKVNDRYGHQKGDEVLKQISELITENIRSTDVAGRWGGEEFLVICPESDSASAEKLAEKMRIIIENYEFMLTYNLTASFGISQYEGTDEIANIICKADRALYQAKHEGRNRVIVSK